MRNGGRVRLLHVNIANAGCCKDRNSAVAHEIATAMIGRIVVVSALRADVGYPISGQIVVNAVGMPVRLAVPSCMCVPARNVSNNKCKRHQGRYKPARSASMLAH